MRTRTDARMQQTRKARPSLRHSKETQNQKILRTFPYTFSFQIRLELYKTGQNFSYNFQYNMDFTAPMFKFIIMQ